MEDRVQFKSSLSENGDYIHIAITDDVTLSLARDLLKEMVRINEEHKLNRILLDVRNVHGMTTPSQDYDIAYNQLSDENFSRKTKLAFLRDPDDTSHSFIETVGQNAGFKFKLFSNIEDAAEWLNQ